MIVRLVDRTVDLVTTYSKLTIAIILIATVVMAFGATDTAGPANSPLGEDSLEQEKLDYINANYGADTEEVTAVQVYVRNSDGNVLSRDSMLATLRFQQDVLDDEAVAEISDSQTPVLDVSNLIAVTLAGEQDASLDAQIDALENADEETVRETVELALAGETQALDMLPRSYDPGTATAESRAMVFVLEGTPQDVEAVSGPVADAQQVVHDRTQTAESDEYFMLSGPALQNMQSEAQTDSLLLIGPIAIVLILVALTFAYRDVFDVLVGMFGVVITLVWMFGLIGWLNVPVGPTVIIAPILLIGLSIDYGLHVFMRYREERGSDGEIRSSMRRALSAVAVALLLVTTTTAIGFFSNLTSPLSDIRTLAIAIALGVFAALVVFVTIVPAVKVETDALLERFGSDRRRPAIGVDTGRINRFLSLGVSAARRSAVAVVVVALLITGSGVVAFGALDTSMDDQPEQAAQWQQDLPEPFAMQEYDLLNNWDYVQENFQRSGPGVTPAQILVEGDVTAGETLLRMDRAEKRFVESPIAFQRGDGTVPVQTPLSVMRSVAADDAEFEDVFVAADTTGDGVPDQNVREVFDALFVAAPDEAAQVIEQQDGEYQTSRMILPASQGADFSRVTESVRDSEQIVAGAAGVTATATGQDVIIQVQIDIITENILQTLIIALGVILALVSVLYRIKEGSAILGALTVLPIAMVVAWVFGAMFLLNIPLTLLTALMMSLAIGLGTDYTIHITERFTQELDGGLSATDALENAVGGTGGALLGSTVTTVAAFATLTLLPFPDIRQLGLMVALALLCSFVMAVFVLPSILTLWAQYVGPKEVSGIAPSAPRDITDPTPDGGYDQAQPPETTTE